MGTVLNDLITLQYANSMAIRNPPDLYNGAAVVFNSNPYTQYQLRTQAEQKAKDEALDEYYRNLHKSINPNGVRTQDMEGFMQKTNGLQEYYRQNKDKVKNPRLDNGKSQTQYESMYQDALAYIQQSKNEELKKKPLIDLLTDPDKRKRVSDAMLEKLHLHDLPLTDQKRRSFETSDFEFNAKPFDQADYLKGFADVKMSEQAPTFTKDGKTLSVISTTKSAFDDDAKKVIASRASGMYHGNESFRQFVDKELNTKEAFDELNPEFKKTFGHDIKSPTDMAAAYTLSGIQQSTTKTAVTDDWMAREGVRNANATARLRLNDALVRARKADGAVSNEDDVFIDDYLDDLAKTGEKIYYSGGNGNEVAIDPTMAKALTINNSVPDKLIATSDGKFLPIFYQYKTTEKNGVKTSEVMKDGNDRPMLDKDLSKPLTRKQVKLALGVKSVTGKQRVKEMTNSSSKKKGAYDDL